MSRITQVELAKRLGVSQQAVSFALTNTGTLAQATRDRILEEATRLGYRPNAAARSMLKGRMGNAAILANESLSSFMPMSLVAGVHSALEERGPWGVRPTDLGHLFAERMQKVVSDYDDTWSELRQHARGKKQVLRVGYIGSAASSFLTPALAQLREELNETQLILMDMTPGEQIEAIRAGRLDVALVGQEGVGVSDEFYTKRVATLGVCVAVGESHPLAKQIGRAHV